MNIKTINDINTETDEGKLLIMALSKLTCTVHTDKTPDEVVNMLVELAEECYK